MCDYGVLIGDKKGLHVVNVSQGGTWEREWAQVGMRT